MTVHVIVRGTSTVLFKHPIAVTAVGRGVRSVITILLRMVFGVAVLISVAVYGVAVRRIGAFTVDSGRWRFPPPIVIIRLRVEFLEEEEEHDGVHSYPPNEGTWVVAVDE